ncbi:adenosine 5'-monophosphoramidase HINT3-like isoform X3 [Amphiura filiformis]|uniref:adenosine 5'-monophosphoramidase HINT3-like isoform X3 n=1 Tax=Amphiura filiformis TaxID=82378 RepID=UPI003B2238B6
MAESDNQQLQEELKSDIVTHGEELQLDEHCIFCKIIQGKAPATILFKNSEVTVFYDIHPASKEHLLIVPNCHHGNPKSVKKEDLPIVEYMHKVGRRILETKGATMENTRSGFHWPPFNTVQHLHLHMIYPENEMRFVARLQYKLKSAWFVTVSLPSDTDP